MESAHAAAGTAEFCDDRAERIFVMAVWLALSLGLLAYVLTWARDLPYMDDWELVPVLAGARPFSLDWLLEQTFEQRAHARRQIRPLRERLHDLVSGASSGCCGPLTHGAVPASPSYRRAIASARNTTRAPRNPFPTRLRRIANEGASHSGTSLRLRTAARAAVAGGTYANSVPARNLLDSGVRRAG